MDKRLSDLEFKRQFDRAKERGKERELNELRAKAALFDEDSNSIVIELLNGVKITLPSDSLVEFKNADPKLMAKVELSPSGNSLHWTELNVDFSIGAVIKDVFGKDVLTEHGRAGGSVSSEAKRIAARMNGLKGGRPRKIIEVSRSFPIKSTAVAYAHKATSSGSLSNVKKMPAANKSSSSRKK